MVPYAITPIIRKSHDPAFKLQRERYSRMVKKKISIENSGLPRTARAIKKNRNTNGALAENKPKPAHAREREVSMSPKDTGN
jgi:hypothetical protein